jgi:Flp pilus assembly CpaF family ATPase
MSANGPCQVRIAVVVTPAAVGRNSVYACLRIPRSSGPSTLDEFVANGTLPSAVAAFLRASVRARLNMVISGGAGAGKTTLMRALCAEVPDDEVLLVIEDSPSSPWPRSDRTAAWSTRTP